jgi:hypothetical protein
MRESLTRPGYIVGPDAPINLLEFVSFGAFG